MKKKHYDTSELRKRINSQFGDFDEFCKAAGLDPIDFTIHMYDSDLTAEQIKRSADALGILPEEIGFYYFRIDETYRDPGRPKAIIKKTTTPPTNNRYYTISEAVQLLGVHRHTLQDRLRKGEIRGKLIGRTWRIYRDELFDNSPYLYYFDCTDAVFGDKYLTPQDIDELENNKEHGQGEALPEGSIIAIARNIEATLHRCNSDKSNEVCIYDCMDL